MTEGNIPEGGGLRERGWDRRIKDFYVGYLFASLNWPPEMRDSNTRKMLAPHILDTVFLPQTFSFAQRMEAREILNEIMDRVDSKIPAGSVK